jgi:hypothetical protein
MMPEHNVYSDLISQIEKLVETGRKEAVTAVNQVMVATYWGVGRHLLDVFSGISNFGDAVSKIELGALVRDFKNF